MPSSAFALSQRQSKSLLSGSTSHVCYGQTSSARRSKAGDSSTGGFAVLPPTTTVPASGKRYVGKSGAFDMLEPLWTANAPPSPLLSSIDAVCDGGCRPGIPSNIRLRGGTKGSSRIRTQAPAGIGPLPRFGGAGGGGRKNVVIQVFGWEVSERAMG